MPLSVLHVLGNRSLNRGRMGPYMASMTEHADHTPAAVVEPLLMQTTDSRLNRFSRFLSLVISAFVEMNIDTVSIHRARAVKSGPMNGLRITKKTNLEDLPE